MRQELEGYAMALVPLVVPCLIFPLQDWSGLPPYVVKWYRSLSGLGLDPRTLKRHFTFTEKAFKEGRWWTAMTYMFRHQDKNHLYESLFGLCWQGRPVYAHFGSSGLWSIFLSGGVVTALDLANNKNVKLRNLMVRLVHNPLPKTWAAWAWVDKATKSVSSLITPFIAPYVTYQGASGGVFAIMGTTACIHLEQLYRMLRRPDEFNLGDTSLLVLDMTLLVRRIMSEYELSSKGQYTGLDYVGHMNGLAVGVLGYALLTVGGYAWRWYRRRKMGRGRTLGRGPPR